MSNPTHFAHPLAVEAWDAWFRWRTAEGLKDLTIDDTWTRVAAAVAAVEGGSAPEWSARFGNALRHWQMLPDEGILTHAGTGRDAIEGARAAVINAAAFVNSDRTSTPRIDRVRLSEVAELAVRFLCDAIRLDAGETGREPSPHVGLLGVADALAALGLRYDSEAARAQASEIAAAVHKGCLQGIRRYLAEPNFPKVAAIAGMLRGNPDDPYRDQLGAAGQAAIRHSWLTALTPHPRLALLANHRGDMVDASARSSSPRSTGSVMGRLATAGTIKSPYQAETHVSVGDPGCCNPAARVLMRAAVQPWIDMPINAPYLTDQIPDPAERAHCAELARRHGLPTPRWHIDDGQFPSGSALD